MSVFDLASIGLKALEYHGATAARKSAERVLTQAYIDWKYEKDLDRVEIDSPEWNAMLEATKDQYLAVEAAKRTERLRRDRLTRVCKRAQKELQVQTAAPALRLVTEAAA